MARELEGMGDEEYAALLADAQDEEYRIVARGGMATKTAVEDVLMGRWDLTRGAAHAIMNAVEGGRRCFVVGRDGVRWQAWVAGRPAPQV